MSYVRIPPNLQSQWKTFLYKTDFFCFFRTVYDGSCENLAGRVVLLLFRHTRRKLCLHSVYLIVMQMSFTATSILFGNSIQTSVSQPVTSRCQAISWFIPNMNRESKGRATFTIRPSRKIRESCVVYLKHAYLNMILGEILSVTKNYLTWTNEEKLDTRPPHFPGAVIGKHYQDKINIVFILILRDLLKTFTKSPYETLGLISLQITHRNLLIVLKIINYPNWSFASHLSFCNSF